MMEEELDGIQVFKPSITNYLLSKFNTSAVISPLILHLALSKLASFAEGEVGNELLSALGYKKTNQIKSSYEDLEELLKALKHIDFVIFNRIFVNYSNEFNKSFMSSDFGVQVDKIGFNYPQSSASFINKMIDGATYKRINDVVDKNDINNETSLFIVSAAHLKVTWEIPFDLRQTIHKKFRLYNGTVVSVPTMRKTDRILYVDDDLNKIKVINMKLASAGVSLTIVMPIDNRSMTDFLTNLEKPSFFRIVKKRMRFEMVNVELPRFKIKTTVDWTSTLQKIGLKNIFAKNNTGLKSILKDNGISPHHTVHLSKVKQKIFVQVDEMGAFRMEPQNVFGQPIGNNFAMDAIADRPFFFSVGLHHDRSDYFNVRDLFNGVYFGPE